jgi:hypothetical protein
MVRILFYTFGIKSELTPLAVLKLRVNQVKNRVGSPTVLKFLGFSLWRLNGKSGIKVLEKSLQRFKARVKEITSRSRGRSLR